MKDYKKILKGVVNIINATEKNDIGFVNICDYISENCPELKGNEDEKIRKEIVAFLKENFEKGIAEETWSLSGLERWIDWLEKQSEQKPADKVEPKFHEGEWITHNTANFVFKIINVGSIGYDVVNRENYKKTISFDNEDNYHLWSIQDAKNGDVLVKDIYPFGQSICIFKEFIRQIFTMKIHCSINNKGQFIHNHEAYYNRCDVSLYPATKEQCDLFFQKMKEAGYEWDSEKKELKKIDTYCQENCKGFQETGRCFCDGECKAKKEHIKQNLQNNSFRRMFEQKPAWSEEDEELLSL